LSVSTTDNYPNTKDGEHSTSILLPSSTNTEVPPRFYHLRLKITVVVN